MTFLKTTLTSIAITAFLTACSDSTQTSSNNTTVNGQSSEQISNQELSNSGAKILKWEDLMPVGEDKILAELYSEFFEEQQKQFRQQMTLSQAANTEGDLMSMIGEGSAEDTMEQVGTYNVVEGLDGTKVRLPGYVVPLDFNSSSEYDEFLLVPYFGACLHTPPPPPNQIVFVKSSPATKISDIYEPVWIEGVMKTGEFGSDLGNSAYELTLAKLEPYEY